MLGRFRSAIYNAIGTVEGGEGVADLRSRADGNSNSNSSHQRLKYAYQRPVFLQLFTDDEVQVTADHVIRPIMVPRDVNILPWFAGYAESINAGKSLRNEDQATVHRGVLRARDADAGVEFDPGADRCEIPYVYFGIFDGHAGSGCAIAASNELHQVVHKRLLSCLNHLVPKSPDRTTHFQDNNGAMFFPAKDVSVESLIIGALESAFMEMDAQIGDDKKRYKLLGGCTVLVALFILGKLYVANAGDSRASLCRSGGSAYPMSFDFTPVTERQRLQQLGRQQPHLMGAEYTDLDFYGRKPTNRDLGKRMLYRDAHMTGWAYKEVRPDDLRFPIVYGEGKRSRLLATIGVTRGFGDHDLKAQSNGGAIYIKPFLTAQPQVRVLDVENESVDASDVLVMATDGLWDVVSNDRVAELVDAGLRSVAGDESRLKYRFISVAQELVMAARGKLVDHNWRQSESGSLATIDDISVFVIPILAYKREYDDWKSSHVAKNTSEPAEEAIEAAEEASDMSPDIRLALKDADDGDGDDDDDDDDDEAEK